MNNLKNFKPLFDYGLDADDMAVVLRQFVRHVGSQAEAARQLREYPTNINRMCGEKMPVSARIADQLGWRRTNVVSYEKRK